MPHLVLPDLVTMTPPRFSSGTSVAPPRGKIELNHGMLAPHLTGDASAATVSEATHLLNERDAGLQVLQEVLAPVVEDGYPLVRHGPVLLEEVRHAVGGVHPGGGG